MILSFASSKGGVGKSTTCAAIGGALAAAGEPTLIIDLDQNRTLHRWAKRVPIANLAVESVDTREFAEFFNQQIEEGRFAHICIDLPGSREVTLIKAAARSDLVIIPAQASEPDLREALVVAADVRDVSVRATRPIPYKILLTKVYPLRTRVADFIHQELVRHRQPVFETALVERSAYREMFLTGRLPTASEPDKAGAEIMSLLAEIRQTIDAAQADMRRAG